MPTVAFVVHPERAAAADAASEAGQWLRRRGHGVVDVPPEATSLGAGDGSVDLAVSLGGDGTMLRTVALASAKAVPVLGVNLGRLGYLTEVEPSGLVGALERFLSGDFEIEERMTLEVSVQESAGAEPTLYPALNEAVVEKTVPGHTVRISAGIGGRDFATYAVDGLLVCTPTGSTAYNLSVRGPILSPRLRAMVVTPISPHMVFDRPLVLEPSEWLRLEVEPPRPAVLVVDGQSVGALEPGAVVCCREGRLAARLVVFGPRDFQAILRSRFGLTDR